VTQPVTRAGIVLALAVMGCASRPPSGAPVPSDQHIPDYAKRPFEPFARRNALAIAEREWRAFGAIVQDTPPDAEPALDARPDRQPGLWQRVGDYWWFGQDAGSKEGKLTPRYDEFGIPYDGVAPAWSAAFISYVMRASGAGDRFPYSPLHADYINAAARQTGAVRAEAPDRYAPHAGDLICFGRGEARAMRFEDLPGPRFLGHCDLVTAARPGQLTVIGGNVGAAVTKKYVPTTPDGLLWSAGQAVDERYEWFVVVRILYDGE